MRHSYTNPLSSSQPEASSQEPSIAALVKARPSALLVHFSSSDHAVSVVAGSLGVMPWDGRRSEGLNRADRMDGVVRGILGVRENMT